MAGLIHILRKGVGKAEGKGCGCGVMSTKFRRSERVMWAQPASPSQADLPQRHFHVCMYKVFPSRLTPILSLPSMPVCDLYSLVSFRFAARVFGHSSRIGGTQVFVLTLTAILLSTSDIKFCPSVLKRNSHATSRISSPSRLVSQLAVEVLLSMISGRLERQSQGIDCICCRQYESGGVNKSNWTYVRPAAFHSKAMVRIARKFVIWMAEA